MWYNFGIIHYNPIWPYVHWHPLVMLQKPVGNLHWDAFLLGSMEMSGRLPSPKAVDWRSWWRFLGASIRNGLQYASYILSYIYILLFIYYHCLCTYIILHDYDMNIWYVDTWYVDIWYILYRYIILIDTYIYIYICGLYDYVGPKKTLPM